jgi:transposase
VPVDPQNENENLRSDLRRLADSLDLANGELALAHDELKRKDRIIAGLQQQLFGSSSEKLDPNQLQLDLDALTLGKPAPAAEGDAKAKPRAATTRRTKEERFPKNLKVVIDQIIIPDEVAANPDAYEEIGEVYHDEIDVTKGEMFWRRQIRKKFVLKADASQPPVIAPAPLSSIPGTLVAPALAAQIITDKFADHLPHYRQSQRFRRRHGADIGRQTLNTWTHAIARHLIFIGQAILLELRLAGILQIDETPIDYLSPGHGSTKQGYLWVYHDPATGNCYYDWHAGRGHDSMFELLGYDAESHTIEFTGTIQCDGFSAYTALANRFAGVTLAGCLAHLRRGFVEAKNAAPEITLPVLLAIQRIYFIETQMRQTGVPPACRELIRRSRSLPLADGLHELLLAVRAKHLPQGDLGQAVGYALNQWDKIMVSLKSGEMALDNNAAENLVRPTKLGMRNWMFFGSLEAGKNNALLYTLMANCRQQNLDPEVYLTEVFQRLPHHPTLAQAAALTPARLAAERLAAQAAEVA